MNLETVKQVVRDWFKELIGSAHQPRGAISVLALQVAIEYVHSRCLDAISAAFGREEVTGERYEPAKVALRV